LQEDTHDAGSDDLGLEHTPDGAGPMFSSVPSTSYIFIHYYLTCMCYEVDLVNNVAPCNMLLS
jgi:hypothetical protein